MSPWPSLKRISKAEEYLVRTKAFGFMDGGCLIFADAIKLLIPEANIVTILRSHQPDHYGISLENQQWGDARGLHHCRFIWAQKFSVDEHVFGRIEVVEDFIPSNQVPRDPQTSKILSLILCGK